MFINTRYVPDKQIAFIVANSRTGRRITPASRTFFMENHSYTWNCTTLHVLQHLRKFVANDCNLRD